MLRPTVKAYMDDPEHMLFAIGSTVGPHPFPMMVRDFQAIVGFEAKEQFQELTGGAPDILLACVGGGCNSLGLFTAFLDDNNVQMIGVEPGGHVGASQRPGRRTRSYGNGALFFLQHRLRFVSYRVCSPAAPAPAHGAAAAEPRCRPRRRRSQTVTPLSDQMPQLCI